MAPRPAERAPRTALRHQHLLWTAWSRAVRAPARFDRELLLPGNPPFLLAGGPDFRSEIAHVYELGYRAQLGARASLAATGFYHGLDKVRTVAPAVGGARESRTTAKATPRASRPGARCA